MAWLKVYQWEFDKWPEFQKIKVNRFHQGILIGKLCRHFKVPYVELRWSYQHGVANGDGGGSYHPSRLYPFIRMGKLTTLGTLCHEFAHHLAYYYPNRLDKRRWHGRNFRRNLKRVYTWSKRWLPSE